MRMGKRSNNAAMVSDVLLNFFVANGLTNKNTLVADCLAGPMEVQIENEQQITVNIGKNYTAVTTHKLHSEGLPAEIHAVATGNPHGRVHCARR